MKSQKMETERWGKTHSLTHISASPLCWLMMLWTSSYVLEVKGIPFHSNTCIPKKTNLSIKSNVCYLSSVLVHRAQKTSCVFKSQISTPFQRTSAQCSSEHHVFGYKLTWMYNICLRQHANFVLKNRSVLTKHMHSVHTSIKKTILNKETSNCNH